jgi:DNA-directed RNA polymerase subunit E'/Rpb7
MPKEYTYKAENEMWVHSEDDASDQEISKGCVVRLRVVNVNFKSKTALVRKK